MAHQAIRDARRAVRAAVHRYPEIKDKAKQATNSDEWGPTDGQKIELASAAHHPEDFALIVRVCWKRILDDTEYWMHVFKALDVLEFLLMMQVPGIDNEIKMRDGTIASLMEYSFAKHDNPERREQLNNKVRSKARKLLTFLHDAEALREERDKVLRVMSRIPGIDQHYAMQHLRDLSHYTADDSSTSQTGSRQASPEPVGTATPTGTAAGSSVSRSSVSPQPAGVTTGAQPRRPGEPQVATLREVLSHQPQTPAGSSQPQTATVTVASAQPASAQPSTTSAPVASATRPMPNLFEDGPRPTPTAGAIAAVPATTTTTTKSLSDIFDSPTAPATKPTAVAQQPFDPFADFAPKPAAPVVFDFGAKPPPAAATQPAARAGSTSAPPSMSPVTSEAPKPTTTVSTSASPKDPLAALLEDQLSGLGNTKKTPSASAMSIDEAMRHRH